MTLSVLQVFTVPVNVSEKVLAISHKNAIKLWNEKDCVALKWLPLNALIFEEIDIRISIFNEKRVILPKLYTETFNIH